MGKVEDNAQTLKTGLATEVAQINGQIALVDEMVADTVAREAQAKADGIEIGKGMIQIPDPSNPASIYSQQQMNDAVNAGQDQLRGQLQPQIDAAVTQAKTATDALAGVQASLDDATKKVADLQAAMDADAANDAAQAQLIVDAAAKIK